MQKKNIKNNHTSKVGSSSREKIVRVLVFLGFVALAVRVFQLTILDSRFLQNEGENRSIRGETIPAFRGLILDRNNYPLAISTPVSTIFVNPKEVYKYKEALMDALGYLDINPIPFIAKLEMKRHKSFMYVKRHVPPDLAQQLKLLKIPGLYIKKEYKRFYPYGDSVAHVVGMTNVDGRGAEGVELKFDDQLSGKPGYYKVIKSLKGNVVKDLGVVKNAEPGQNLKLTIDTTLQSYAYEIIKKQGEHLNAESISLVTLDVHSGEILTLVNWPSFNPNDRSGLTASNMRNRAVTDLFEPGSTVKPLTVLSALEYNVVGVNDKIDATTGKFKVGPKTISDHKDYGIIGLRELIVKSSNVASAKIALQLESPDLLSEQFGKFGFGQNYQYSDLPGMQNGYLPEYARWKPVDLAALSYGYGMSTTVLQLAKVYSTLARGGQIIEPYLLYDPNKIPETHSKASNVKDINHVLDWMVDVTSNDGTARLARINGYSVAGKTGTVHKVINGKYASNRYLSLFAGIAPRDNPRFVTVVSVNDPKGKKYYGGLVAAPLFSSVMEKTLYRYNVPPSVADADDFFKKLAQ